MPFKSGDLARIARQPRNQTAHVVGGIGFIEEIDSGFANIQTLSLEGMLKGWGTVPVDCLEPVDDPDWMYAYESHRIRVRIVADDAGRYHELPPTPLELDDPIRYRTPEGKMVYGYIIKQLSSGAYAFNIVDLAGEYQARGTSSREHLTLLADIQWLKARDYCKAKHSVPKHEPISRLRLLLEE